MFTMSGRLVKGSFLSETGKGGNVIFDRSLENFNTLVRKTGILFEPTASVAATP